MELWSTNETVDVRVLWLFESFQDYKLRLANYRPHWVCCLSVYSQSAEHGAHGYVYWNFLAVQWLRLCLLVQDMRLAEELRSHQAPGQNTKTENRNNIVTQFSKYFWKICACLHAKSLQSCLTLWDSLDCSLSRSSVQRSDQGRIYWSGLPIPSPEDLPDPGIKPGGFFTTELPGKSMKNVTTSFIQEFFLFLVSLYDSRIALSYYYCILNFLNKDFMDIRLLFGYKIPP